MFSSCTYCSVIKHLPGNVIHLGFLVEVSETVLCIIDRMCLGFTFWFVFCVFLLTYLAVTSANRLSDKNKKPSYRRERESALFLVNHCHILPKSRLLYYISVPYSMGPPSVNLTQLAPKATVLCEITHKRRLGRSRSLKVIDFGINRKPVCYFLLVNDSNFHLIWYRFRVIVV